MTIMACPVRESHEMMCQWDSSSILFALKFPLRLAGVKLSINQVWNPRMKLSKDKINNSPSPMRRGFVVGSEYKLETFWLRSQLKRNIVSIKWQNNWTEKKNNPE